MYNYGYGQGWSPVPSGGVFGEIAHAIGGIGQQASAWFPFIAQMQQQQDQTTLNLLQQPNLPADQKQALIGKLSPRLRNLWPKENIPGQVLAPGQAAVPGQPAQTFNVPRGLARAGAMAGEQAPTVTAPAIPDQPAVPEVRAPSTERFWVPPTSIMDQSVGAVVDTNSPMFHNMPDAQKARIMGLRLGDAIQVPGLGNFIGQSLGFGGGLDRPVSSLGEDSPIFQAVKRAGFDPMATTVQDALRIPGVDVAVARQVEFGQGASGTGVPTPGKTTYGEIFQGLGENADPDARALASQPVPESYYDLRTGTLDRSKVIADIDRVLGTPAQRKAADRAEAKARYDKVVKRIEPVLKQAEALLGKDYASSAEAQNAQRQSHILYERIRGAVAKAVEDREITEQEGQQILAPLPTSFTPGVRPPHTFIERPGTIPANVHVAITAIQKQIDTTPPGSQRDALVKRLQAIYDQYHIEATAGGEKPQAGPPIVPPPMKPSGHKDIILKDPNGITWTSDGVNWWYWDGKKWEKVP